MIRLLLALLLFANLAMAQPVRVALVGDSTVADYDDTKPHRGWGQLFRSYFGPEVVVENYAVGGRSSKSFVTEGRLAKALEGKPEYLFIQFGHNDRARKDERRFSDPATTYPENLRAILAGARAAGAKPILVTPPAPRGFSKETGKLQTSLAPYAEAMRRVGREEGVPVIDLYAASYAWTEKLGPEASIHYAPKERDINHYNEAGARVLAGFVVAGLPEAAPELAKQVRKP